MAIARVPRIAFGHANGGQFVHLHRWLNERGLAHSWLFCSQEYWEKNRDHDARLIPCELHGPGFRKLSKVLLASQISHGIFPKLFSLHEEVGLDLYFGHVLFGSPLAMFRKSHLPLLTYAEFPCFRLHGLDSRYPSTALESEQDDLFEMLTTYCVLSSVHTFVPSLHAKSLFAQELQTRITAQVDGLPRLEMSPGMNRSGPPFRVGFLARDLSAAKGFDRFVKIANEIARRNADVQFVVMGGVATPYGNETLRLAELPGRTQTFCGYVLSNENPPLDRFQFEGKVPRARMSEIIRSVDVFIYPLQFGSGNWGLLELLGHGAVVIASSRCYLPEFIRHGHNGFLLDYEDTASWADLTLTLLAEPARRASVSTHARAMAAQHSIDVVAPRYLARIMSASGLGSSGPVENQPASVSNSIRSVAG